MSVNWFVDTFIYVHTHTCMHLHTRWNGPRGPRRTRKGDAAVAPNNAGAAPRAAAGGAASFPPPPLLGGARWWRRVVGGRSAGRRRSGRGPRTLGRCCGCFGVWVGGLVGLFGLDRMPHVHVGRPPIDSPLHIKQKHTHEYHSELRASPSAVGVRCWRNHVCSARQARACASRRKASPVYFNFLEGFGFGLGVEVDVWLAGWMRWDWDRWSRLVRFQGPSTTINKLAPSNLK